MATRTVAASSSSSAPPPSEQPTVPPPVGRQGKVLAIFTTIRTARPAVVFGFSLLSGVIVSAILIVLSVPASRNAWGHLFAHPGATISTNASTLANAYGALLTGSLGSPTTIGHALAHWSLANWAAAFAPIGSTISAAAPLAIAGFGLSIAFRSGVFNIGASAQLICGGITASWVGFSWGSLPMPIHVGLGLLAGAAGGAIGGLVPGLLKVRAGASEVITTIMLNYIMAGVLVYLTSDTFFSLQVNSSPVGKLTLPSGTLPFLFGRVVSIDAGVIVAVVVLIAGWLLLSRSRLGFEFELSGMSPGASKIAGIRQAKTFVMAFMVSGACVGLAGGVEILGSQHQLQQGFGGDLGSLVITVAFVGRNKATGVGLAALLYGLLQTGGLNMQGQVGISYQLSTIIEAVIVLFMVAPAFVAEIYRLRPLKGALMTTLSMSQGWGQ